MNAKHFWRLSFGRLLCLLVGSTLGVTAAKMAGSSPTSKSLARLLEEHYRLPTTFQAVFLERFSEGPRGARMESGTVYFHRPGQMRWEYESPEKKLFLVDGQYSWFYVPYDHTVTKTPVKESSDWRTPLALLTRKTDLLRLCGQLDVVSEPAIPTGHSVLRCIPRDLSARHATSQERMSEYASPEDLDYLEVRLEMDASTGELARIEIRQPGGVELEYRFGNWQTNVPLPADFFHFQVPAGVAIVDGSFLSSPSN